MRLLNDMGEISTRHALDEHHQIDELVEEVQKLEAAGDAWIDKARELSHKVHHHLREGERKFFQVPGKILSDPQTTRMAS